MTSTSVTEEPVDSAFDTYNRTVDGFNQLEKVWGRYLLEKASYQWDCSINAQGEQCYRNPVIRNLPGPNAWRNELFPSYGFEPQPPDDMAWSYGVGVNGNLYLCLRATNPDSSQRDALKQAKGALSPSRYLLGVECGTALITGELLSSVPLTGSLTATYWLKMPEGKPAASQRRDVDQPGIRCTPGLSWDWGFGWGWDWLRWRVCRINR